MRSSTPKNDAKQYERSSWSPIPPSDKARGRCPSIRPLNPTSHHPPRSRGRKSSRNRSRSTSIPRQRSLRPRHEAQHSISPVCAIYNHADRASAYPPSARNPSPSQLKFWSGRASTHVSQGEWYERSPHLRDGRVHEIKQKSKTPKKLTPRDRERYDGENRDETAKRVIKMFVKGMQRHIRLREGRWEEKWVDMVDLDGNALDWTVFDMSDPVVIPVGRRPWFLDTE